MLKLSILPAVGGKEVHKFFAGVCTVFTNEQVLAAVEGEMCVLQAKKLRIIHSHMGNFELCELNLESLILEIAKKHLPQPDLVMTMPGIQSFAAIGTISELGVDMFFFPLSGGWFCALFSKWYLGYKVSILSTP